MNSAGLVLAFIGVVIVGGLGSVLRFWLSRWDGYLPWGILIANTLGSFVLGLTFGVQSTPVTLWLAYGLAGGLSTFSSFVAQTGWLLWKTGRLAALGNVVLNVFLPMLAVLLGLSVSATLLN